MAEFELRAAAAVAQRKKQALLADEERRDEERRAHDEREEREWDELEEALLATAAQLGTFHEHLDRYHTATVAALMENETALAAVRVRLDEMLGRAYTLPDGRRVFRSEDGQRVFDEAGTTLGRETIDPAMIGDGSPSWEAFTASRENKDRLERERVELLRYQDLLDAARERVERDPITRGDLDALDADLEDAMPEAVRRQMGGNAPGPREITVETDGGGRLLRPGPQPTISLGPP